MDLKQTFGYKPVTYYHNSVQASMQRTSHLKYASYHGDGSGRDTYIVLNNGGLTSSDKQFMMTRNNKLGAPCNTSSPKKDAVSFKYYSDGTGRDSYVMQNSGGLQND